MPPLGIWSDGATMWVADDADDRIYVCAVTDDLPLLPVQALTLRAALSQAPSVLITYMDGGSDFMPYVDGMTMNTDTPGFRGTSDGYDTSGSRCAVLTAPRRRSAGGPE